MGEAMSTGPYRAVGNPGPITHDEMLRRETNEKLSKELVQMAASVRKLFEDGQTVTGEDAMNAYERMARVLKDRGV